MNRIIRYVSFPIFFFFWVYIRAVLSSIFIIPLHLQIIQLSEYIFAILTRKKAYYIDSHKRVSDIFLNYIVYLADNIRG